MWRMIGLAILSTGFGAITARGTTYLVTPDGTGDFPTLQAAVDACRGGDVIELADGIFRGPGNYLVDFPGYAITVHSKSGYADRCVLDAEGHFYCLSVNRGQSGSPVIENLSFANSENAEIAIGRGSPIIRGCIFRDTRLGGCIVGGGRSTLVQSCLFSGNHGPGVMCVGGSVEVAGCEFRGNDAYGAESGLSAFSGSASVKSCTFSGNRGGPVVSLFSGGSARFDECTFAGNDLGDAQGMFQMGSGSDVDLTGCIIALNTRGAEGPFDVHSSTATLSCCDVFGNASGDWTGYIADQQGVRENFSLDPLFCDLPHSKLFLCSTSPCAPEHSSGCGLVGALPVGCGAPPEPGACCFAGGSCGVMALQDCERAHGSYRGDGVICVPSPCIPIPVDETTWGRVKSIFR